MAAKFYGRTFVILFIELFLVILSECCIIRTNPEIAAEEMVAHSDYVLFGKVLERIKDPRTNKNTAKEYGIRFEVICIYKGNSTGDTLNKKDIEISGGGNADASCYPMNVDVNGEYVLYLNKDGNYIVPSYGAPTEITKSDRYEVVLVCDMIPYAPGGSKPLGEESECPASEPSDCVRYEFPTEPPKKVTVKVEKPVPLPTTPATKADQTTVDKGTVQGGDKKGLETKDDNSSATLILTSMLSLVICLLSALLMS